MSKIDVDSREEGNTLITSSQKLTKQAPCRKNHFFTYNNYIVAEIEDLVKTLKQFAYKGKIQTEVGESGTPHLQGMVWCNKPHRDTEFKLSKKINWRTLKDVDNKANYCGKDESHDGVYRVERGFPKPLKILKREDFYEWESQVENYILTEPDDRKIYWIVSKNGCLGKSTFCKYLAYHHRAVICGKGNYADIMNIMFNANMDESSLVVFDLPRNNGNKISYSALEAIKNGLICNTKYETGSKLFNPPHIVVFANAVPEWDKMSEDRFVLVELD